MTWASSSFEPVNLSEYPALAPEGFLTDLKARTRSKTTPSWRWATGSWEGFPPSNQGAGEESPLVIYLPLHTRSKAEQPSSSPRTPTRMGREGRASAIQVVRTSGKTTLILV